MNISLKTLKSTANINTVGYKIAVYGDTGGGKTHSIKTAPNPFVLSSEMKLGPLADTRIPYYQISTFKDLVEGVDWFINSNESKIFETLCIDSLSKIADLILREVMPFHKDGRAAYGDTLDKLTEVIDDVMQMDKHAFIICQQEKDKDEATGKILFSPKMPGKSLNSFVRHNFHALFRAYTYRDDNGNLQGGFQTMPDNLYNCSNSLGGLELYEPANIKYIFDKIKNQNNPNQQGN